MERVFLKQLSVVGIGSGSAEQMTLQAKRVLENADILVGYTLYIELLKPLFPQKDCYATPMMGEVARCQHAINLAESGKHVALVCSGDAGVYGMASLLYELAEGKGLSIEVIPGVTAALSGGALVGAPLSHDFAVISFSDWLTEKSLIEKRLALASKADFCLVIYNPASKRRADYLKQMCQIVLQYRPKETICAVASKIGRTGEGYEILSLDALQDYPADMFCTIFIGNYSTRRIDGKMVTPRGYRRKYGETMSLCGDA